MILQVFIDDPAQHSGDAGCLGQGAWLTILRRHIGSSGRGIGEDFKGLVRAKRLFSALSKSRAIFLLPLSGTIKNAPFPERTDQRQLQTDAGV